IERQWKESHPYFKVTSPNHSYFGDMGMPKLLKSVDKVDDHTVKIVLSLMSSFASLNETVILFLIMSILILSNTERYFETFFPSLVVM
ncbi:MAG: hypothetical protein EB170_07565, partial [Nitrosopumilaceae archaeon]|nr:hypothetical protein [Nitrosopumilaceae archaeon]